jgi:SAM-dependent methyltransferase
LEPWKVALPIAGNLILTGITTHFERLHVFRIARKRADELGKPLLNYGCGITEPFVSLSDVNADIVPRNVPNFVLVRPDGSRLPFYGKEFGAAFVSHVLEHVEDPEGLMAELCRVSDYVYIIVPHWWSLGAWLHPGHRRMYIGGYGGLAVERPQSLAGPLILGLTLILLSS